MLRLLLLLCAVLLSCATAPLEEQGHEFGVWGSDFSTLRLSFTHPETRSSYTVEGPYRVVETSPGEVELEGRDPDFLQPVRLLLFARDETIWALARIDGQEFLTRVH